MPTTPPENPRPRRVRAGHVRARGASNGNGNGNGGRAAGEGPTPAGSHRRLRRDLLVGRRRQTPPRRRPLLRTALLFVALFSTIGAAAAATVYTGYNVFLGQIPDATTVASMEPAVDTNVYAANGTLIDILHPSGSFHLHANLDRISAYLQEATVDIEDRHFYSESSLDLARIAEAGWGYVRHANAGGASTIPEQLAKISFLQDNGSISYKIKEIILGSELVDDFSKGQILEMYLNRIPYGNQAIGIQTAAELYFHVPASQLDLAQSAMLAGLPQAPSAYDPDLYPAAAKQRQEAVLQAMVNVGSITQAQANAAAAEKLTYYTWEQYLPPTVIDGANTSSFLDFLTTYYLPELFHGDTFSDPGGYDIYTTLNLSDQATADATVHSVITGNPGWFVQGAAGGDGALVSLDPQTGAILAMTGSANYSSSVYGQDNLAIDERQPGSTMKLFTYTDAIASRQYTMTTQISDEPMTLDGWTPKDYEGASAGEGFCEMEYCLGNSLNLPAVRTEYALGVLPIANLAVDAGVSLLSGSNFPELDHLLLHPGDEADQPPRPGRRGGDHRRPGRPPRPGSGHQDHRRCHRGRGLRLQRRGQRAAGGAGERRLHHGPDPQRGQVPPARLRQLPEAVPAGPSGQRQDRDQRRGLQQLRQLDRGVDPDRPHRGVGRRSPGRERQVRAQPRCHQRCDRGGPDLADVHGGRNREHAGGLVPAAIRRL